MSMTLDEARKILEQAKQANQVLAQAESSRKKLQTAIQKSGYENDYELARALLLNMSVPVRSALVRSVLAALQDSSEKAPRFKSTPELAERARIIFRATGNYGEVARQIGCSTPAARKLVAMANAAESKAAAETPAPAAQ